jgi:caa(3)-type oxidase subunit IV
VSTTTRKNYLVVFGLLCVLTVAEVGVVYVPGIARAWLIVTLVLMAFAKAGLVIMTFMHLSAESRMVRLSVLVPFVLPPLFALVLIADAGWRLLR